MANYEVTIEALSPIHIGGAQGRLTSLDFWQDENCVYLVSENKLAEILSRLDKIDDFVNFVKKGQHITLDDYLQQRNLKDKISHEIVARRIEKGEPEICSNIMPFITDGASGEPYLPASSVKGALRGAILYQVAKDSRELSEVKRKIKEMADRGGRKDKNIGEKLDDTLRAQLPNDRNRKTPHGDWLRALRLTDAYALQGDFTEIQAVRIVSLNGDAGYHYGAKGIKLFVEVIRSGAKLKCRLTCDEESCGFLAALCGQSPPFKLDKWLEFSYKKFKDVLMAEKEFFHQAGLQGLVEELERIESLGANIRLGWGAGLLSSSLILRLSKEERIALRNCYFKSYNHLLFPKSRKVAVAKDKPAHTFGWAKITVNEITH